jgi:hypothetical protein
MPRTSGKRESSRRKPRASTPRIPRLSAAFRSLPDDQFNRRLARHYVKCGLAVGPMSPNPRTREQAKNPGALCRAFGVSSWSDLSTRDLARVDEMWRRFPEAGVFIDLGKSGLFAPDIDRPDAVPGELRRLLRDAPRFTTSESGARRHILFRQPEGRLIGNSKHSWGEVKGFGGVLVVAPTVHPDTTWPRSAKDPDDLGCYGIGRSGAITEPSAELLDLLALQDATSVPIEYVSDASVEAFLAEHTESARQEALKGALGKFSPRAGERHNTARDALCWGMREARAGAYSAREFHDALRARWEAAYDGRPAPGEWEGLARFAVGAALASDPAAIRAKLDRNKASARPVFTRVSARELAAPVPPMRWLVRDLWARNSFGPLGGEKKTLKTYNLLAMAIAVASGEPVFGHFPVEHPGPVVLYIAEGGREPFQRRAQRVADAYKVKLEELPIEFIFGMAPLNGTDFLDSVHEIQDDVQPVMIGLDPLYAFHPAGIDAGNIYERGPMLQQLRADTGEDVSLVVPDHFNKTAAKGQLDLDMIAQAGWGPAADSWILQGHREPPDLGGGLFRLALEIGSRQWGGHRYSVDWTVPNPELDENRITWDVSPLREDGVWPGGSGYALGKAERAILEVLDDHPFEFTRTKVVELVGGKAETVREAIDSLLTSREIESRPIPLPDASGVARTQERLGRTVVVKYRSNVVKRRGAADRGPAEGDRVPGEGRGRDGVDS